ncbi:MAG: 30S ribosomal protein S6 [Bacteroidota bacterium]|nr:30S ribosomal protein S6 [Bacteroidota bacterium]
MENTYEITFIMNPVLSEEQVKETADKFISLLKSDKAKIINEENWGLKKLKYSIQNKKTGFYYMIEFQSEGKILHNFEVELQRDERILRWLTVKLDKFALEYSEKRKNKLQEKSKEKNE